MTILAAIVVLGILIFVHELGHFLVAKRSGVGVLKFSLGFGPKLLGVKRGETEYLLSAFPLGGYVKMIGEDPADASVEAADPARSFSQKSVATRARIILAGPVANLLLPVAIFWGVFATVGQPYFLPIVGAPDPGSPAAQAGLLPGDRVQALNGERIERWTDVEAAVQASAGTPLNFTLVRDGRAFDARLTPRAVVTPDIFGQETQAWDVGLHPLLSTRIGQVLPGHVAEQAGLRSGDLIVALNGTPIVEWEQLAKTIHESPGKPVRLTVERDGRRFDVLVTPRLTKQQTASGEEEIGLIGIGPAAESHYQRLNPVTALVAGAKKTAELSVLIVQGFVKLIEAKISPKTIGGPILIGQLAGEVVQRGPVEFLSFTALLSINLAILNLLPIPVLDGGHLLFSLIEWLRGKPVSLRKREIAQQVGMVLLVGLMIFAFYNDITRWLAKP
jgi:regulator of sigma E protease